MTAKPPRLPGLNPAPNNGFKKRVFKACERCKLKKVKCEGVTPCKRCKADDVICLFKKNNSRKNKEVPTGYVEFLETRYQLLAQGLRESHARLVAAELLPQPTPSQTTKSKAIEDSMSIQSILVQLGVQATDDSSIQTSTEQADPAAEFSALRSNALYSTQPTHMEDTGSDTTETPTSSPTTETWPIHDKTQIMFQKQPDLFTLDAPSPGFIDQSDAWGFDDRSGITFVDGGMPVSKSFDGNMSLFDASMLDTNFSNFMTWDGLSV